MTSPMGRGLFEPAVLSDLRPSKKSFFFIALKIYGDPTPASPQPQKAKSSKGLPSAMGLKGLFLLSKNIEMTTKK